MSQLDDAMKLEVEAAVKAQKTKIDKTIIAFIAEGMANGEILEEHFERAPNGDSWFRLIDQQDVEIVFNYSKKTVHSYGSGLNSDDSSRPMDVE
jgi:hypothetical protein